MSVEKKTIAPEVLQRVIRIQNLTVIWMSFEAAVALGAAWMARSPALLAFGGDSGIELISALVVRRRFQVPAGHDQAESRAARISGFLRFALAARLIAESAVTLFGHAAPKQSYLGISVLIVAAIFMPWLAKEKRRLSAGRGGGGH